MTLRITQELTDTNAIIRFYDEQGNQIEIFGKLDHIRSIAEYQNEFFNAMCNRLDKLDKVSGTTIEEKWKNTKK